MYITILLLSKVIYLILPVLFFTLIVRCFLMFFPLPKRIDVAYFYVITVQYSKMFRQNNHAPTVIPYRIVGQGA
jgi:hypothetical protein